MSQCPKHFGLPGVYVGKPCPFYEDAPVLDLHTWVVQELEAGKVVHFTYPEGPSCYLIKQGQELVCYDTDYAYKKHYDWANFVALGADEDVRCPAPPPGAAIPPELRGLPLSDGYGPHREPSS